MAVGSEKMIFTETEEVKVLPRSLDASAHQVPQLPVLKHHLSQLALHHSGRIFFAGVGELGDTIYPGAI